MSEGLPHINLMDGPLAGEKMEQTFPIRVGTTIWRRHLFGDSLANAYEQMLRYVVKEIGDDGTLMAFECPTDELKTTS